MTTPPNPAGEPEPMTLAEIRALLEQTAKASAENTAGITEMRTAIGEMRIATAENTRAIAEMRADNVERAAKHDREMAEIRALQADNAKAIAEMRTANAGRDARHDKEMAEIREAIARLTAAQDRANQDVSTLKGWGLELYCERNPGLFAEALGMIREELIPKREIRVIAHEAELSGVINADQFHDLSRADLFIYARRKSDLRPFCLVIEASFRVDDEDVNRAVARARVLSDILQQYQPRNLNGQVMAAVAGTHISDSAQLLAKDLHVAYIQVQNGNRLTNPPE